MSRSRRLRPLAGLVAMGLAAPAFAQSVPFPKYTTGIQSDGSFVVGTGQIIKPTGKQVDLGDRVRSKAVAINPTAGSHTGAVLTLGANQAVEVFDTLSGEVLQNYLPSGDSSGSYGGISYSADGKYLMFSQDSSYVAIANVSAQGLLTDFAHVSVPPDNTFIQCFPNSPMGDYGRSCGTFYSTSTSYPGGVAFAADGKTAYALLNQNNTLAKIDLTQSTLAQGVQIQVGNAPHSIVLNGTTAYVSNEGGRPAVQADHQTYSAGTEIVSDSVSGSSTTGTVSVVNLSTMTLSTSVNVGLHPTGMALYGNYLLVANAYDDTISVVDTTMNQVSRTISLALPIAVPGQTGKAYGAAPVSIAVDNARGVAYVALYNANAIAVVDLSGTATTPILGMIPTAFAPCNVVLDSVNNNLIVANDKGVGTLYSYETDHGVTGYNTHQDNGTVSIIPVPTSATLTTDTTQVNANNHWDLTVNITSAGGGKSTKAPVALPEKIGDPSLIKHVFLIIRENRTYDQVLGDVKKGNGDASLAVFGGKATPNAHALVQRFPLFDNFYDPARQSADGHQWIVEAMAPYADDIQSPDWVRSYPGGNAGDSLAYTKKGFLFQEAVAAKLSLKIYGEYAENETFPTSLGHPTWSQFYSDAQLFEAGKEKTLKYQNAIKVTSTIPAVSNYLIPNFPQFDLDIPDQFRVDLWAQDFKKDVAAGTVPNLSILWVMDDHTGGPPTSLAEQADNDLAIGRIISHISHSKIWDKSAIFIEEDDAQNGVDHVDGHRSPAFIVSPYAVQNRTTADSHYYTQVNMTRTIEQILGLPPMNQFDLVASPMATAFVKGTPPDSNFEPFNPLLNQIPLNQGVTPSISYPTTLAKQWAKMKTLLFKGKNNKPDAEDAETVNHMNWYEATNYTKPYPGEKYVRPPQEFKDRLGKRVQDDDGDGD